MQRFALSRFFGIILATLALAGAAAAAPTLRGTGPIFRGPDPMSVRTFGPQASPSPGPTSSAVLRRYRAVPPFPPPPPGHGTRHVRSANGASLQFSIPNGGTNPATCATSVGNLNGGNNLAVNYSVGCEVQIQSQTGGGPQPQLAMSRQDRHRKRPGQPRRNGDT